MHYHFINYDQLKFERECLEEEVMVTMKVRTENHLQEIYFLRRSYYLKIFH